MQKPRHKYLKLVLGLHLVLVAKGRIGDIHVRGAAFHAPVHRALAKLVCHSEPLIVGPLQFGSAIGLAYFMYRCGPLIRESGRSGWWPDELTSWDVSTQQHTRNQKS